MRYGFRLCLTRPPQWREAERLVDLFREGACAVSKPTRRPLALATKPLGPCPQDMDAVDLAAWTVVGNVLLNLDETLAKR